MAAESLSVEGDRGRSLVGGSKSLMVPYGSHFEGGCMSVRRCSCGGGGGLISRTQYHFDCVPGYTTMVFKSIIQYGFMPGKNCFETDQWDREDQASKFYSVDVLHTLLPSRGTPRTSLAICHVEVWMPCDQNHCELTPLP